MDDPRAEALEDVTQKILRCDPLSKREYFDAYSLCYEIHVAENTLQEGGDQGSTTRNVSSVKLLLENNVRSFLQNFLKEIKSLEGGVGFLELYSTGWENLKLSAKVLNGVFSYVTRHVTAGLESPGDAPIRPFSIFHFVISLWSTTVFAEISEKVYETTVQMFHGERKRLNSQVRDALTFYISGNVLKSTVDSFIVMDDIPKIPNSESPEQTPIPLTFYGEFEFRFLEYLHEFMTGFRTDYFSSTSSPSIPFPSYVEAVKKWMSSEETICQNFLSLKTKGKVKNILHRALVISSTAEFSNEFNRLLLNLSWSDESEEALAEINSIYKLVSQQRGQTLGLAQAYTADILTKARGQMEMILDQVAENPQLAITTIIGVHRKYGRLTRVVFEDDPVFSNAFSIGMSAIVNFNSFTYKTKLNPAEYCARCFDLTLRNKEKLGEDEVDVKLDGLMSIFKYLKDKDIFLEFYARGFADRLLRGTSYSDDAEEFVLNKLKDSNGYEYTLKLGRMSADIQRSKELCSEFKDTLQAQSPPPPFSFILDVRVLTSGCWPFNILSLQNEKLKYSPEMAEGRAAFTRFYLGKYTGRKLTWVAGRGNGEVTSQCFSKPHSFILSTYQMTIIDLYNSNDTLPETELLGLTGIEPPFFKQVIEPLVKIGLLKRSDSEDETLSLNLNFSHENIRIKCDVPLRSVAEADKVEASKSVEFDRKSFLEASIVRIMKDRKKLSHQALVTATVSLAKDNFTPDVKQIKKVIDSLIERDYLERDKVKMNHYLYIA